MSDASGSHRMPLEAKVAFLQRAASFPEGAGRIEAIETHMSWVFLTERHAYKLKKPVRTDFLDYGSITARGRHCEAEVGLNRRLAGDVYVGTVRLVANPTGTLQLGGEGRTVDWLVKMRRLPAPARLDDAIAKGGVDENACTRRWNGSRHSMPMDVDSHLCRYQDCAVLAGRRARWRVCVGLHR